VLNISIVNNYSLVNFVELNSTKIQINKAQV